MPAYQLAVVVDDAQQGITEVCRGTDLLDNTPRQIFLQQTLGLPTPRYLHFPLVLAPSGEKLSKQTGAPALEAARAGAIMTEVLRFLCLPPDDADIEVLRDQPSRCAPASGALAAAQ